MALFYPLLELSCGRNHKIEGEFNYFYNAITTYSDSKRRDEQVKIENLIRSGKKY